MSLIQDLIENSYIARYFLLNAVDITDHTVFPSRPIQNATGDFHFAPPDSTGSGLALPGHNGDNLETFLSRCDTTAFLVIQDDKLLVEQYFNGWERASICTSFSVAKSFVSALVGIALHDKLIRGLDDPVNAYLTELPASPWAEISLRHLVGMCSGLGYNLNGFFPWNDEPRVYYSPDLRRLAVQAKRVEAPGLHFHYNNFNLVLLGMILERVTGGSVSAYLQEKLWQPLGMDYPASWSLDSRHSGMEKMESGLNARAVDFARFGRLYLRRGDWQGKQIIPESWVAESTTVEPGAKWSNYKYLWWMSRSGKGRFTAVGNLGQFIFVAPDKNCVILRFGRGKPADWKRVYPQLFGAIADAL
jgi:CubicO group peptidase (beta-lactamase class C family)